MAHAAITPMQLRGVRQDHHPAAGLRGAVNLTDEQGVRASRHTAVLGACAAHHEQIPERFAVDAAAKGEVVWICDEPFALRPAQVEQWYAEADRLIIEAGVAAGVLPADAFIRSLHPTSFRRSARTAAVSCPGEPARTWPTRSLATASAWECRNCRAAGIFG